ncbi:MAG: hypothetical protein KJS68_08255, partial [Alphaproteobacteria bacterium]|nr:hypothetical protein [Alphaproteobacteria bacterium]
LTSETMSKTLAWTNFALSAAGTLVLIPSLAIFLATNNKAIIPEMVGGELLTALGLATFLVSAGREFIRKRA